MDYLKQLISVNSDQCLEWPYSTNDSGYGLVWLNGMARKAHRVSWSLVNGEIPKGMMVCHKCDNRICVNPNHLFIGTAKDNAVDSFNKGRQVRGGELNGRAKLMNYQVIEIKRLLAAGERICNISRKFNIPDATIDNIKSGRAWGNLALNKEQS
jgi:hypothetical protein